MKTLVLATVLAAASPTGAAETTDDPFQCRQFGQDIVHAATQARENGTTRADFLATMGLMDHDRISVRVAIAANIKIILDSVFLLCIRPLNRDHGGEIARVVMTNVCFEAQERRRRG